MTNGNMAFDKGYPGTKIGRHFFSAVERYGEAASKVYRDGDMLDVIAVPHTCLYCGLAMQDLENGVQAGCEATYYGA